MHRKTKSSPIGQLLKSTKISKTKERQLGKAPCSLPNHEGNTSLKWMPQQSQLKPGTCITKKKKKKKFHLLTTVKNHTTIQPLLI